MNCIVYTDYAMAWFDLLSFQVFTALAFSLFAQESVDIAIVEVSIMLVLLKNHGTFSPLHVPRAHLCGPFYVEKA